MLVYEKCDSDIIRTNPAKGYRGEVSNVDIIRTLRVFCFVSL